MAHFNAAPVIAINARNTGTRKRLKSVYYDTPERTLRRNGLSLRVRQSGARFVQTVKTDAVDDPLRRGEWEASVPSLRPISLWQCPSSPRSFAATWKRSRSRRAHRRCPSPRAADRPAVGTVEIAFDQGVLTAADRSQRVSEIELELKSGSASAVYEIALRLAEHGGIKPSIRTKSAAWLRPCRQKAALGRQPRKLRLDASVTLDEAFATILRSASSICFSRCRWRIATIRKEIHQLRASLRRLRSVLDLMRSAGVSSNVDTLRTEAKWLAQDLSAARDWDVFQIETLPTIVQPSVGRGLRCAGPGCGRAPVRRLWQGAWRPRRSPLRHVPARPRQLDRGARLARDVETEDLGQLAEPAADFAARILSAQYAKVLKRGRRFKSLSAEGLHRVRLATKRLRYLSEFLLPLFADRKSTQNFRAGSPACRSSLARSTTWRSQASLLDRLDAEPDGAIAAAAIAGWRRAR